MFRPQVILHPTDFSAYSRPAFDLALDLAQHYQAAVLVLHVVETLGPENVTYGEAVSQLEPESYRQRLQNDLLRLLPPADSPVTVHHLLAEGKPAQEIERVVQEKGCGLIVMGTHGRTGLQRLLMGSIAEHVVRHASCPVLTVKT